MLENRGLLEAGPRSEARQAIRQVSSSAFSIKLVRLDLSGTIARHQGYGGKTILAEPVCGDFGRAKRVRKGKSRRRETAKKECDGYRIRTCAPDGRCLQALNAIERYSRQPS